MAASLVGCSTIIAIGRNEQRLDLAKELGATHVVRGYGDDALEQLGEMTGGLGLDYTVENTGVPAIFRMAVDSLSHGGTCGLIGVARPGTEVPIDMSTLLHGRTIRGICEGDSVPRLFIPQLVELYRQGRFPFDRLIKKYPFGEINQATSDMESGKVVKPVLTFD